MYSFGCTRSTNFYIIDYNSFWKIHCVTFFPYKSVRDQIWPCRKIDQGQPRVIRINLVVLEYQMLHTKFQGHWPFGSREEDFFNVFTPYGHGHHFGHVTWKIWTNFRSPSHGGFTWNLALIGPAFSKEKKFKNVESEWPWPKVNAWPWPLIFI